VRAQTSREMFDVLDAILSDPVRMHRMSANGKRLARPHAADAVAEMLEDLVSER